jgi:DNA-directed RNA polymerase specialized sigma24 family protein
MRPTSHSDEPSETSVDRLRQRCKSETEADLSARPSDTRYCHELFRRALTEQNQDAWEAIYSEFALLVRKWISEHPGYGYLDLGSDTFVNCAFTNLWRSLSARERFARFPELAAILAYLRACARSCVRDEYRRQYHSAESLSLEDESVASAGAAPISAAPTVPDPGKIVLEREQSDRLHRTIARHLQDERDRFVFQASFEWSVRPGEIFALRPDLFSDVQHVYRVKRNLLDRLSRDPEMAELARIH